MQRKKSPVNYKYVKYTFMTPEKKRLKYWTKYAIAPSMYEYRRCFIAGKFYVLSIWRVACDPPLKKRSWDTL